MSRDLTLTANIVPQPTTVLQSIAQKMVAGEWVHLDGVTRTVGTTPNVVCTKPANIDYVLAGDGFPTEAGQLFVWGSRARWNPVVKSIEFCGGNVHTAPRCYGRYTEADHRFESWVQHSPEVPANDPADYRLGTHTFDRLTVNPYTGQVWQSVHDYPIPAAIFAFDSGPKSSWADYRAGNPKTFPPYGQNLFSPTDWWSEPSSLTGAGAQGLLIVVSDRGPGNESMVFQGYNPLTNTWPFIAQAPNSNLLSYNRIGQYSKVKNCFVTGCGNGGPTALFRLSADGTITKYAPMPFDGRIGQAQWADDPTTGNFLVIHGVGPNQSDAHFWQFNPDTDVWTQLPNLPVGMHWHVVVSSNSTHNTVVTAPLYGPEYNGVIAYICSGNDYGRMWLYKHA